MKPFKEKYYSTNEYKRIGTDIFSFEGSRNGEGYEVFETQFIVEICLVRITSTCWKNMK